MLLLVLALGDLSGLDAACGRYGSGVIGVFDAIFDRAAATFVIVQLRANFMKSMASVRLPLAMPAMVAGLGVPILGGGITPGRLALQFDVCLGELGGFRSTVVVKAVDLNRQRLRT